MRGPHHLGRGLPPHRGGRAGAGAAARAAGCSSRRRSRSARPCPSTSWRGREAAAETCELLHRGRLVAGGGAGGFDPPQWRRRREPGSSSSTASRPPWTASPTSWSAARSAPSCPHWSVRPADPSGSGRPHRRALGHPCRRPRRRRPELLDTYSDRMNLFAACFGLLYSRFTPRASAAVLLRAPRLALRRWRAVESPSIGDLRTAVERRPTCPSLSAVAQAQAAAARAAAARIVESGVRGFARGRPRARNRDHRPPSRVRRGRRTGLVRAA